jgi:CTP:molybdopterin cytidylyltransferase MocA
MIWAVVLAAGASSRMGGEPKALLRTRDGQNFLSAIGATARAAGCGGVMAVVGPPHGDAIRRALPAGMAVAVNPRPERGMLSSVQAGIAALPPAATAALVWPVDIPFVRAETVRRVLDATPGKIIVPVHNKGGHPVRIARAFFAKLAALDVERGLRGLLQDEAAAVVRLPVDDPGVLVDVDTPADYARLTK